MTERIVIRPAERSDLADLVTMGAEFDAYLRAIEPGDPPYNHAETAAALERFGFGETPLFSALIATGEGQPAGYAIYNLGFWADADEGMVFVTDLYVREAWRGRGVGRRLMDELAAVGEAAGCQRVMWTVWKKNPNAIRFYRALGAEEISEELLMTRPIGPSASAGS